MIPERKLLFGSYIIMVIASWALWIQGWDLGLLTHHYDWRVTMPLMQGLFIAVGALLSVLNKLPIPSSYVIIDSALTLGGLVVVPLTALNRSGDGWLGVGVVYFIATATRGGLVLRLLHQATPVLSNRWCGFLIAPAFVIVLSLQVWRIEVSPLKGDEPYYLVITHSLVKDRDVKVANNFQEVIAKLSVGSGVREFYYEKDGQKHAVHPPGLPLFLVPGYVLGGARGGLAMIALASALLLSEWMKLARLIKGSSGSVVVLGYLLCFSYPLSSYATNIYPAIPAACILTVMVRLSIDHPNLMKLLVCAVGVVCLTMLKVRLVLLGLPLFVMVSGQYLVRNRRAGLSIALASAVCVGLLLGYNYHSAGFIHLYHRGGELVRLRLTNLKPYQGFFGLLMDQQFGLLWRNPVYLLGLTGMIWVKRKQFAHKWFLLLTIVPYIATVAAVEFWTGGSTPPARFLVPVLPIVGLFALPALESGILKRVPGMLMIWVATISTLTSLFAPQFDIYSVDPVMGVARLLTALSRAAGYPLTQFFPSYFRTSLTTHLWSALLVFLVCLGGRKLGRSGLNGSASALPSYRSLFSKTSLAFLLVACVCALPAVLLPPLVIYPQDMVYEQDSGFPRNDSFIMDDRYSITCKTYPGPQTVLLYAADDSDSLLGQAVTLEVAEQQHSAQRIMSSQVQPLFWRTALEGSVAEITIRGGTTQQHNQAATKLNRVELLPSSPFRARLTLRLTKLLGPLWSKDEVKARAIRAYLLDSSNAEAAQRVIEAYLAARDALNLTYWLADFSPQVIKQLPAALRLQLAEHLSFRNCDALATRLLAGPFDKASEPRVQELHLIAQLRQDAAELVITPELIASTNQLELKYRGAVWFLKHHLIADGLRISEQVLNARDPTYNQLLLNDLIELGLPLPSAYSDLTIASRLLYAQDRISATVGMSGRDGWHLTSNGSLSFEFPVITAAVKITLRLKGSVAMGQWPEALVHFDGKPFARFRVTTTDWFDHEIMVQLGPGRHVADVEFTNDFYYPKDNEDRNLAFNVSLIDTAKVDH